MKKCANPECGLKELTEFYHDRTRHDRKCQYCKVCFKERIKKRYESNPDLYRTRSREQYRKTKREVMDRYGKVCQCCGESHLEFLTLDHINQDGAEKRREMGFEHTCTGYNFYLWLRRQDYPDLGLQVLCANCNTAKGAYGKCPHQVERENAA
jgi:5-methylcytosine-specific restriction endonuclease McrA